jgi:hypothetical protein
MEPKTIRHVSVNHAVGRGEDQRHNADSVDGRAAQVECVVDQHCDAADTRKQCHCQADRMPLCAWKNNLDSLTTTAKSQFRRKREPVRPICAIHKGVS